MLAEVKLCGELYKAIDHFFPGLICLLKQVHDPRHQSYVVYGNHVLLMTRILSAIFYTSSMREASAEFNCQTAIENIGKLCGEDLEEVPYWETINNYLVRVDPDELQKVLHELVRRLVRSKAFNEARVRGKYWQVIVDGTQLASSSKGLDGECLFRIHNRGKDTEYRECYYYVLEAKVVLHANVHVSIMTEFVENKDSEAVKQDCERAACWRLMERLKKAFPRMPICMSGDSLYACQGFFDGCRDRGWRYILRYKEGSIPSVMDEFQASKNLYKHRRESVREGAACWHDYVEGIKYRGRRLNVAEYGGSDAAYPLYYVTDLPISEKNVENLVARGRMRWAIENKGFNAQKNHGFNICHLFSRNCTGMKNHYYLIQVGHMIAQVMDSWAALWKGVKQSVKQKHRRLLESWKTDRLSELIPKIPERFQIRLE